MHYEVLFKMDITSIMQTSKSTPTLRVLLDLDLDKDAVELIAFEGAQPNPSSMALGVIIYLD